MPRDHPESVLLAPLPLRLVLGLTFLWAGWGKLQASMPVKGDDAARLANMGIISPAPPPASPKDAPTAPIPTPKSSAPSDLPAAAADARHLNAPWLTLAQAAGAPPAGAGAAPINPVYTAADFPNDVSVKRLWGIALRVSKAGDPAPDANGAPRRSVWPRALSSGLPAKLQAQAVLGTELLAGAFLLLGFLTRLSSLALAGVMLGAIWLDQCAPAIQAGTTTLGLFPAHDRWDVRAWMPLLWQCSLFAGALTLALLGGGRMSFDRAMTARTIVVVRQAQASKPVGASTSPQAHPPQPPEARA